jgi:hypothetical protein
VLNFGGQGVKFWAEYPIAPDWRTMGMDREQSIGANIKAKRLALGLKQEELAAQLG